MEISFEELLNKIIFNYKSGKRIVLFNIGSSKVNGDCFGPMLGSILKKSHLKNITVLGSLNSSINALNIEQYYEKISDNDFIICTDACIKKDKNNKKIYSIFNQPIKPGKALDKDLGSVGDVSICFYLKNIDTDEGEIMTTIFLKQYDLKNVNIAVNKIAGFFEGTDKILNYIK